MRVCLSHDSALEYYRALPPDAEPRFAFARPGRIASCSTFCSAAINQELDSLGVRSRPVHLLCSRSHRRASEADVARHTTTAKLARSSVISASGKVAVCAPPLVLAQMATRGGELDAALLAFEFCGTYASTRDGFVNRCYAITDCARVARFAVGAGGLHGIKAVRRMTDYLMDGSASPMETAMAMLLCAPPRLGGVGFARAELNKEVETMEGIRRVDLLWPQYNLGLEYQSEQEHSGWAKREADDRRRNAIVATGVEILSVYYRDLSIPSLFDRLVDSIALTMGVRARVRMKDFRYRQNILRSKVLPPVRRNR